MHNGHNVYSYNRNNHKHRTCMFIFHSKAIKCLNILFLFLNMQLTCTYISHHRIMHCNKNGFVEEAICENPNAGVGINILFSFLNMQLTCTYISHHRILHCNKNGFVVEAICENPNAGVGINIRVEIVTGQCYYSQTEPAHFHTGWSSPSRMHIEEVRMSKSVDAGKLQQ